MSGILKSWALWPGQTWCFDVQILQSGHMRKETLKKLNQM